jgi:hypothetical protein
MTPSVLTDRRKSEGGIVRREVSLLTVVKTRIALIPHVALILLKLIQEGDYPVWKTLPL